MSSFATQNMKRVLITSSVISNPSRIPALAVAATASLRVPAPSLILDTFNEPFEAFTLGMIEVKQIDAPLDKHKTCAQVSNVFGVATVIDY